MAVKPRVFCFCEHIKIKGKCRSGFSSKVIQTFYGSRTELWVEGWKILFHTIPGKGPTSPLH